MKNQSEPPKIKPLTTQSLPYDELLKTCNELQVQLIQTQTQLAWAMEQIPISPKSGLFGGKTGVKFQRLILFNSFLFS